MNHASLFSGIGGFDLAAEWMGWNNVFHCEWSPFCQRVLKYYWPNAKTYSNVKTTDFSIWRGHIDILTGGFPCQPYSHAGRRLGKNDERHLWPEMLRAIRQIKPTFVVGENVKGLVSWNEGMVFDEVCADLEAEGYEVQTYIIPACGVGAPHRRERIFFIAYAEGNKNIGRGSGRLHTELTRAVIKGSITYANNPRNSTLRFGDNSQFEEKSKKWKYSLLKFNRFSNKGIITNTNNKRLEGETGLGIQTSERGRNKRIYPIAIRSFRKRVTANAYDERLQRERVKRSLRKKREVESYRKSRLLETAVCGIWQSFPTQSPVCGRDDGIPRKLVGITFPKWRNEAIKAFGNAVVPQVIHEIFKAIEIFQKKIDENIHR